jgi:hypothetical protein
MTSSNTLPVRSARRNVLLTVACVFGLMLLPVAALNAADKALPLTGTFEKVGDNTSAPFVLTVKNTSKESIKVSGKVLLAVVHHAMDKARTLPEQTIEAGGTWSIKGLVADDRVILTAPGYAEIEFRVPFKL